MVAVQAAADEPGVVDRSLALRLVITGTEPLSGSVGPEQSTVPMAFSGWIGLMSAINELVAQQPDSRPEPLVP